MTCARLQNVALTAEAALVLGHPPRLRRCFLFCFLAVCCEERFKCGLTSPGLLWAPTEGSRH